MQLKITSLQRSCIVALLSDGLTRSSTISDKSNEATEICTEKFLNSQHRTYPCLVYNIYKAQSKRWECILFCTYLLAGEEKPYLVPDQDDVHSKAR